MDRMREVSWAEDMWLLEVEKRGSLHGGAVVC
jgi:hypothetical protein